MIGKYFKIVIGLVFVLALLPLVFDEVAAFAVAYPEWAVLIGLIPLTLIVGLVWNSAKGSGVNMS